MVKTKRRKSLASLLIALIMMMGMMVGGSANVFADTIPASGTLLWSYFGGNWTTGGAITPPTYYDGNVYVAVDDGGSVAVKIIPEGNTGDVANPESISLAQGHELAYWSMIAPTYDADVQKLYVPMNGGIEIVDMRTRTTSFVQLNAEYTSTVLTYDDEYIYAGLLNADYTTGDFCKIKKDGVNEVTYAGTTDGYLWATPCPISIDGGSYVLIGSNTGKVYLYGNTIVDTLEIVDTFDVGEKINSSMTADGSGNYYFSTKGGKLYKVYITAQKEIKVVSGYPVNLTAASSCTPLISNGKVYVGTEGQTVDVFSTDGSKDASLSVTGLAGNVQGLTALNGKVYASYNNRPGGLYNVTEKGDFYVPAESMKEYNAYLPVTNGTDKIFFKNDSGYLMAVSAGESNPGGGEQGGSGADPSTPDDSDKDTTDDDVTVTEESTDTATKTSDDFNLIAFAIISLAALFTAAAVFRRQRKM